MLLHWRWSLLVRPCDYPSNWQYPAACGLSEDRYYMCIPSHQVVIRAIKLYESNSRFWELTPSVKRDHDTTPMLGNLAPLILRFCGAFFSNFQSVHQWCTMTYAIYLPYDTKRLGKTEYWLVLGVLSLIVCGRRTRTQVRHRSSAHDAWEAQTWATQHRREEKNKLLDDIDIVSCKNFLLIAVRY